MSADLVEPLLTMAPASWGHHSEGHPTRGSVGCRFVSDVPGQEGEHHMAQAAHAGSLSLATGLPCGGTPAHGSHASCPSEDTAPSALPNSVRRGARAWSAEYQCTSKGATGSSEMSLNHGDIW